SIILDNCPVGVNENDLQPGISVFPNPFSQTTIFQFPDNMPLPEEIIITDALGREVKRQQVFSARTEVDRNGLADGLYFYHVMRAGEILSTGKILVQ
ncbi:MAG TPA: T9SS type A sorting domain-containing protein, partial [Bacteroidia bacterium]|nr:T9SS type A sorting domain-containing protein [Bacteroidia bacterium]